MTKALTSHFPFPLHGDFVPPGQDLQLGPYVFSGQHTVTETSTLKMWYYNEFSALPNTVIVINVNKIKNKKSSGCIYMHLYKGFAFNLIHNIYVIMQGYT